MCSRSADLQSLPTLRGRCSAAGKAAERLWTSVSRFATFVIACAPCVVPHVWRSNLIEECGPKREIDWSSAGATSRFTRAESESADRGRPSLPVDGLVLALFDCKDADLLFFQAPGHRTRTGKPRGRDCKGAEVIEQPDTDTRWCLGRQLWGRGFIWMLLAKNSSSAGCSRSGRGPARGGRTAAAGGGSRAARERSSS